MSCAGGEGGLALPHVRGVVWDWGDTLMRDFPGQAGPMVDWRRVEAMPGAAEALEALAFAPVQCVATNATESTSAQVSEAVDRVGLGTHLTRFFTSSEMGVAKPDPGFFLEVARLLGSSPGSLLAVGNDYRKDVVPAKAVGMTTILVARGADPGSHPAADLILSDLGDLAIRTRGGGGGS